MMKAGGIPLSEISGMEIYENVHRENMRAVWNRKQPDMLFDGPFFSWQTYKSECHMKIHGRVITKPNYTAWGIAWNDGEAPQWCRLPCDKDNYFTNTVLVVNHAKSKLVWHKDSDGTAAHPRYTSRPALGFKDTRLMWLVASSGMSLPGLQCLTQQYGWQHSLMLDGGGSTMCKTADFEIYSGRIVPYFILIYFKDREPKGDKPVITINSYSRKRDGDTALSRNFQVKEFACNDGTDTIFIAPQLVELLQKIRTHYSKPVKIVSGYRTEAYNAKVGGAEFSQHKYGTAADIQITGVTPKAVAAYVETLMPSTGGIGIYSTFVHVDVREVKARWNG